MLVVTSFMIIRFLSQLYCTSIREARALVCKTLKLNDFDDQSCLHLLPKELEDYWYIGVIIISPREGRRYERLEGYQTKKNRNQSFRYR